MKKLVDEFHAHGVRVLLPYNPWDTGTARTPGKTMIGELVDLIEQTGADGFNGEIIITIHIPYPCI